MKTVKTIFVLAAMTTTFSLNVMAAGIRAVEVRDRLEREIPRVEKAELNGAKKAAEITRMSQELSKLSSGNADQASLKEALNRKVGYSEGTEKTGKSLDLSDVGRELLRLDQATRKIREARLELTADGKAQLEALEKAVAVGTEFLALAGRTTDMFKDVSQMSGAEKLTFLMFNKQLSILNSLGSMTTADLVAHTSVMEAATKYQGPRVNGDVAFNQAIFYNVSKGNEAKYKEKTAELIDCK